jgi:hypothetical protein
MNLFLPLLGLLLAAGSALADESAPGFERTEEREPCADYRPLRQPLFGDLHVHTALSFDAAGQGTRARPRDAYRFARGDVLPIQPFASDGTSSHLVRLSRPLDFAMVSDHSDMLGETQMCQRPELPGWDSWACTIFRQWPLLGYSLLNSRYSMENPERMSFCGENGRACLEAAVAPWLEIREAAEEAYDRTAACRFTTFVGYEWTGMPGMANIHRNIVFRNERTQREPTTFIEHPSARLLWRELEKQCLDREDGCDVIAIPHNSNVSKGLMFEIEDEEGNPISREEAALRSRIETLLEVTQHKGDSECRSDGLSTDEECGFETLPYATMADEAMPGGPGSVPARVYAREALAEGLVQQSRLGVNPFRYGLVGSTDTHLGTPGLVEEYAFVGHAAGPINRRMKVPPLPDIANYNPGGLAVLWAEENSRDSLFEAMRRREAYGTTGTRLGIRFFGGWDYPDDACSSEEPARIGYRDGVPMGSDLATPPPTGKSPRFIARAWQDPGTPGRPGTPLERLQVIKIWLDGGQAREKVYDITRADGPVGTVDAATCKIDGGGAASLCTVWEDPDFDASTTALYYLRVLESPSCRWLRYACNQRGVVCDEPSTITAGLEPCCDPGTQKVIRERGLTSPIWYTPSLAG